jgi:transcriptional regulator with XRE-family HTH domain
MQACVVELIRELMQAQRMSIRKISAQIAREYGGSALGYTQQINRILNDPSYDPSFSTVQKILSALNYSLWQSVPSSRVENLELQIGQLNQDVADLKTVLHRLDLTMGKLAMQLDYNGLDNPKHL